jgi:hypothetical protein
LLCGESRSKDRSLRQFLQGYAQAFAGAAEGCDLFLMREAPTKNGALFCFRICGARNFHKASKTIRPRLHRRTVINGNAAIDRATFAHRANPGAKYWPTEGRALLFF